MLSSHVIGATMQGSAPVLKCGNLRGLAKKREVDASPRLEWKSGRMLDHSGFDSPSNQWTTRKVRFTVAMALKTLNPKKLPLAVLDS